MHDAERHFEVYIEDVICYVEGHDYEYNPDENVSFFHIGRVVGFDPHRGAVTVHKFHCSTEYWNEELGFDLEDLTTTTTTDAQYSEMCPHCCTPEMFLVTIPLHQIVMTAIEFDGEQMNELYYEDRRQLALELGIDDYAGMLRELREYPDAEGGCSSPPYSHITRTIAQSLDPRPIIRTHAAGTSEDMPGLIIPPFYHMDENCLVQLMDTRITLITG